MYHKLLYQTFTVQLHVLLNICTKPSCTTKRLHQTFKVQLHVPQNFCTKPSWYNYIYPKTSAPNLHVPQNICTKLSQYNYVYCKTFASNLQGTTTCIAKCLYQTSMVHLHVPLHSQAVEWRWGVFRQTGSRAPDGERKWRFSNWLAELLPCFSVWKAWSSKSIQVLLLINMFVQLQECVGWSSYCPEL